MLRAVLAELRRREPIFHHPEQGSTREEFERLTDIDFWETGASGRRYDREQVWAVLEDRYAAHTAGALDEDWETSEFAIREIAPSTYLLTYTLLIDGSATRRVTVWQRRDSGWTILYHQGTPVADRPPPA